MNTAALPGRRHGVQQRQRGGQRAAAAPVEGKREMSKTGMNFNIGEAAERAGVSAKMARHYESLGLLGKVGRSEAGYRRYSDSEIHTLRFIRRSRDLGFSMAEIADLLRLWQDRRRPSVSVKRLAAAHLEELDRKIKEMQSMRKTLQHLVHCCQGNERPECPILDELGGESPIAGQLK